MSYTYFCGSNIFDSMKHCVAIGGATTSAGGAAGGAPGNMLGGCILRALAAAVGIWKPVPTKNRKINKLKCYMVQER